MRKRSAVLLLVAPLSAFAADTIIREYDSDAARVIVEFRDPPLFARERTLSATASEMQAFAARFAQFEADVRGDDARVTQTFEHVRAVDPDDRMRAETRSSTSPIRHSA